MNAEHGTAKREIERSLASLSHPCGNCQHFHGAHHACTAYLGAGDVFCTCNNWTESNPMDGNEHV